ncbi:MAG: amidohydrolase family protein [Planctomycetota bacterium]|jgi:predicted TIM-barrel fold metal-dependent hydrolase
MIIDCHVHIGTSQYLQLDADAEMLIGVADELGIDRLCVTHLTSLCYEMREGNDLLGKDLARWPERLIGYVTLPTHRLGKAGGDEIRRCVEKYGMQGVKFLSHPESPVTESCSTAILETVADLRLPLLGHFTPAECDQLMQWVPEAKIIMAHMGGQPYVLGNWHLAVDVASRHPNLYVDTASSHIDNGMLEYAVGQLGAEKIVFGTDMPLLDPWVHKAKVEGAEITVDQKRLIMGENMQRLLGM